MRSDSQVQRCRVGGQVLADIVVQTLEPDEHFVGLVLVLELRWREGMNEVDVEVALGLSGRAFVRCPEEEVTAALDATLGAVPA